MLKSVLSFFIFLSFASAASAQDVLYKKNGSNEQVKIIEVTNKTIKYKKWNNLNGPDYVLPMRDIQRIKYENGAEERWADMEPNNGTTKKKFSDPGSSGKNIIAIAPLWMTNTSAVGVGVSYERLFGKDAFVSFVLPVAYNFLNRSSYSFSSDNRRSSMLWFYPGTKVYLGSRNDGKVRYGLGVAIPIGTGFVSEDRMVFDPNTQTNTYTSLKNDIFLMGIMVNNSLNIQATDKLYLGLEFGLGIPYFVNVDKNYNPSQTYVSTPYEDGNPIVNFNFRFGYRF